ncbi:unnamed protein product [Didymodactylos carnosus]|uniref:CTCK domain-containing protein n=1 Tax=Didymodactylos carnosus TaxID=1234261 RepID=A0A813YJI1_9BILA|nr:unnamed protein product [Didymodactylos carnosus]CAF0885185.1 unnamed protein product [Didymodactylos carnosus]CAF3537068.1 unnamed protein product [Didymodactylos carnosus]CAF3670604.1 unnamed protein product [Didymodactylos carnosus]
MFSVARVFDGNWSPWNVWSNCTANCNGGELMDSTGQCVQESSCQCEYQGRVVLPGQSISIPDKCQECKCTNGCLTCETAECVPQCQWSDWSPFGECSEPCNGTQARYQTLQGPNCNDNSTNYDTRPCSTVQTAYPKGCSTCTCTNNTEKCVTNCAIDESACSKIQDPLYDYIYELPTNGECCGTCKKLPKAELCAVQQLPAEYLVSGNCTSVAPIPAQQCIGSCISYTMAGLWETDHGDSKHNVCRCCQPENETPQQVQMNCTTNGISTIESMTYYNIDSCRCLACGGF